MAFKLLKLFIKMVPIWAIALTNLGMTCPTALDSDFNIKVGDVELSPTTYRIRHNGKIAQLTRYFYEVYEHILLHDEPTSFADLEEIRKNSSRQIKYHKELGPTGHLSIIKRLRNHLRDAYDFEFSARLKVLAGIGFYWFRPPEPHEIKPNKIWKADDRPYFYFGDKLFELHPKQYIVMLAFKAIGCRSLDSHFANAFAENLRYRDQLIDTTPYQMRFTVNVLNRLASQKAGTKFKVAKVTTYGAGTYSLVPGATDFCDKATDQ